MHFMYITSKLCRWRLCCLIWVTESCFDMHSPSCFTSTRISGLSFVLFFLLYCVIYSSNSCPLFRKHFFKPHHVLLPGSSHLVRFSIWLCPWNQGFTAQPVAFQEWLATAVEQPGTERRLMKAPYKGPRKPLSLPE